MRKDELVRYDNSRTEDEESEYVDFDFVNGANYNLKSEDHSIYCSELNGENKFVGMSRFDEASKAGFALEYNNGKYTAVNSNKKNKNKYETNLTNVNQNFNFDSDMEKVDFENNMDKNKIERMISNRDMGDDYKYNKDDIFEDENYLKSNVFDKKVNYVIEEPSTPAYRKKVIGENKSFTHLNNKPNKGSTLNVKANVNKYSKSIEDYDRVNFNSITQEEVTKRKKEENQNKFNLDKYKINKNSAVYRQETWETNCDEDVELEGESHQIMDFQKSIKENILNCDINTVNYENINVDEESKEDLEIHYINKIDELKEMNEELKIKLKFHEKELEKEKEREREREKERESNKNSNNFTNSQFNEIEEENKNLREEIDDLKSKYERKNRDSLDHKSKYDALLFDHEIIQKKLVDLKLQQTNSKSEYNDKENIINNLKTDIRKKEEIITSLNDENNNYKSQIENIKSEYNLHRQEMIKKSEKLTELQQKIFNLEQENIEIRSKSSCEVFNLREQKQTNENLKLNYMEIKNEYDLINIKFQRIDDENYNLKRDLSLYEKEIKSKNDLIEKLKQEILTGGSRYDSKGGFNTMSDFMNESATQMQRSERNENKFEHKIERKKDNIIFSSPSHYMLKNNSKIKANPNIENYNKSSNTSLIVNDKLDNSFLTGSSTTRGTLISPETPNQTYSYKNSIHQINTPIKQAYESKFNVLPSQKEMVKKETKILEIETKLYTLQQERERIRSELSKLPEYPKQKAQILKKKDYEISITQFNQQVNALKVELRELNALNRDY